MLNDVGSNKACLPNADDYEYVRLEYLAGMQSLSGTGACRIGGYCFSKSLKRGSNDDDEEMKAVVYCPSPTWRNQIGIFQECGLEVQRYR